MTTKLVNGKLLVSKEGKMFEVKSGKVLDNLMLEIELYDNQTNEHFESITVDVLNETVIEVLKNEGYRVLNDYAL